jgi:hypothetical protein
MRVLRHNMPTSADILELLWFPMACQRERVFFYPVYSDSGSVVDPYSGARILAKSKKNSDFLLRFCTYTSGMFHDLLPTVYRKYIFHV